MNLRQFDPLEKMILQNFFQSPTLKKVYNCKFTPWKNLRNKPLEKNHNQGTHWIFTSIPLYRQKIEKPNTLYSLATASGRMVHAFTSHKLFCKNFANGQLCYSRKNPRMGVGDEDMEFRRGVLKKQYNMEKKKRNFQG